MELVLTSTSFLVELLELLFYGPILSWVALYARCLPFLPALLGFCAMVWTATTIPEGPRSGCRTEEAEINNTTIGKVRRRPPTQPESAGDHHHHVRLSGREVEMIMERMGLFNIDDDIDGPGGDEAGVGTHDLSCLFEEKEPSLEEVKEAFRVFDRNGDGFIDPQELHTLLSAMAFNEGSSVDDCRRMIDAYDDNRDGRIDFREFVKFMECSFC